MKYSILEVMFEGESPKSVLEIGCANGGLLKDLAETFPGLKVGGIEITDDIKKAQELFPDQADNFIRQDLVEPWPLEDKSYDIVFSCGVLMYIWEAEKVMKEMFRVGKTVIMAEYHGLVEEQLSIVEGWGVGIQRNYVELLNKIGIEDCLIKEAYGKTLIKCQQKNEQYVYNSLYR